MNFRGRLYPVIKTHLISLLYIFILSCLTGFSQSLNTINLKDIPQKKVRKYIISTKIDQLQDFSLIHSSWKKENIASDFNVDEKTFYLDYNISNVWDCYRSVNPSETWNNHSIKLGLLISKWTNTITYTNNSSFPEVDTGQVYFLDLKLLKGIVNIPVAFEITNIDFSNQIMEFSYIDKNKSKGKQSIQFFDNGDGRTRIVHISYFKSKSWFRDDLLYPYFHKKFITEFHRNMKQLIQDTGLTASSQK